MISQIFKTGGGAGIGSYVIVIEDGVLLNPNAEKIRWSYDSGENLFLSILDDTTEEALLPLTGYVDNDGILHLSGRDFDDDVTYQFTIDNTTQTVTAEIVEGITLGEGIITPGGGGGESAIYRFTPVAFDLEEDIFECQEADIRHILEKRPALIGLYIDEAYIYATAMINNDDHTLAQYIIANAEDGLAQFGRFTFNYRDGAYESSVALEIISGGGELNYATSQDILNLFDNGSNE